MLSKARAEKFRGALFRAYMLKDYKHPCERECNLISGWESGEDLEYVIGSKIEQIVGIRIDLMPDTKCKLCNIYTGKAQIWER